MQLLPFIRARQKPTVLLILQGPHHLMLYKELFRRCSEFHWVCVLENARDLPADLVNRMYFLFGVQIFTDERAALSNYLGIDAVITTYAVPHPAHSRFIRYIALAYEMGLPVFELQHGLFQLGISYSESSAYVGSGIPGALTSLDAPGLTRKKLVWGDARTADEISVGFPPFTQDVINGPAYGGNGDAVLIASNTHWSILDETDVAAIWDCFVHLFVSLPDIKFVLMPHPAEMKSASLKRGLDRCQKSGVANLTVRRPADRNEFISMLENIRVAVSMVSTVLLDFEMYEIPCVLVPCARQEPLIAGLQYAKYADNKTEFTNQVRDAFYGSSESVLCTGFLRRFRPEILVSAVREGIRKCRITADEAVPMIARHLQGVK